MTDPNWFYSALAQSAAAIVGLIGAFVTSRVMMMASERSRIEKRINEINAEIKALERQNTPLLEYINESDRKDKNVALKEDKHRSTFPSPYSYLSGPSINFNKHKYDRYNEYVGRVEKNDTEISYKDAKIQELQNQVSQIILPEHFRGLIFSLIYFTIVGVILPLWLLPITPEQHLVWKPIVLVFFITGLFAVFLYIFIEIKHITKKSNNARTTEETPRGEDGSR